MSNLNNPFPMDDLKEKKLNLNVNTRKSNTEVTDEYEREMMSLYAQLADVFIRNNTKLTDSYVILSSMADAVMTKIIYGDEQPDVDWTE